MNNDTPVGQRIRYCRNRRQLSQATLANQVGRSAVWLSQIERGVRPIDKLFLLQLLANVLEVELGDLIGGISLPPNGGAPLDPPQGMHAIRRAVLAVRAPDVAPVDAATLRADVEYINREHVVDGRYESVALVLPGLLDAGRVAVAHNVTGAWWCLADTYRMASSLARGLGEVELAWIAADRAVTAAQHSGDGLLVALSEQLIANALMRHGWLDEAGAVCSDAVDAIAPTAVTGPQGWSVWAPCTSPPQSLRLVVRTRTARGGCWPKRAPRPIGSAPDATTIGKRSAPRTSARSKSRSRWRPATSARRCGPLTASTWRSYRMRRDAPGS